MLDESESLRSPLSRAVAAPLGRGLYVEPPQNWLDIWLPRLQIAIGVLAAILIVGGLMLGLAR